MSGKPVGSDAIRQRIREEVEKASGQPVFFSALARKFGIAQVAVKREIDQMVDAKELMPVRSRRSEGYIKRPAETVRHIMICRPWTRAGLSGLEL